MSRAPVAAARALASSVLPTPAGPSARMGFSSRSARKETLAIMGGARKWTLASCWLTCASVWLTSPMTGNRWAISVPPSGDRLQGAGGRDLGMDVVGHDLQFERPAAAPAPLAADQRGPGHVGEVGLVAGPVDRADDGVDAGRLDGVDQGLLVGDVAGP